jgi:hypothetical protein
MKEQKKMDDRWRRSRRRKRKMGGKIYKNRQLKELL